MIACRPPSGGGWSQCSARREAVCGVCVGCGGSFLCCVCGSNEGRRGNAVRGLHTKQTVVTSPVPHAHTHTQINTKIHVWLLHLLIHTQLHTQKRKRRAHEHALLVPAGQTLAALLDCGLPWQPSPTARCQPESVGWLRDERASMCSGSPRRFNGFAFVPDAVQHVSGYSHLDLRAELGFCRDISSHYLTCTRDELMTITSRCWFQKPIPALIH